MRDLGLAHQPEPAQHGGLFLVGDYLFDCTLNGVLRSASVATDLLQSWLIADGPLISSPKSGGRADACRPSRRQVRRARGRRGEDHGVAPSARRTTSSCIDPAASATPTRRPAMVIVAPLENTSRHVPNVADHTRNSPLGTPEVQTRAHSGVRRRPVLRRSDAP
jgi:hypothetical protein